MNTHTAHLGGHLWGFGASVVTLLAGAWLVLAPFALGYQPYGAGWANQTHNDFWVGLGVILVSLIGLSFFTASIQGELRDAGVIRQRRRAPAVAAATASAPNGLAAAPVAGGQPGQTGDFEHAMAALAAALAADLTERRKASNGQEPAQLPAFEPARERQP